jgi:tetratricopeptide (TPR) repeat protein
MQCPRCHAENREGRRFCGECGLSFASTCASCSFLNEGSEKFCGGCGRSLAPSPTLAEPKFGSPQSYTPKHLAEKILTSKAALEGERKQVTVLFADLKGSMELLADRDPEDARKLLDPVLEHMMEAVHRYEGTVNQVMGDGIMALFGAPLAHEDHAVRACYAALRMQESVKKYAEGVRREQGVTIRILHRALEQARQGRGQIAAVVGEPGVGKSRLVFELTHSHRVEGWLVLEAGSVSYGKATSYLPVIDLLKGYFRVGDRDTHRDIREKVTGKILTLDRGLEPILPALLTLLDVPADDSQWQGLDPTQRRQRTLDAVKRLLLRESQVQPLLLVFEDLHWIDSETQALLNTLVESLPTVRLLLLVNYRPEYSHGWGNKTYYTQLRLDALPPESATELLEALLGSDVALQPLKLLLATRTGGNPLFLEESVRTLAETGALAVTHGGYRLAKPLGDINVPATVQTILAARIDRLPPDEKQLLQCAAVVGKDVPYALLEAISPEPEERLRTFLGHLQAAEFLYEKSLFPDLEYTFKHALTHEVAYGSLLHERRRALHATIVSALEHIWSDRLTEQAERLSEHAVRGAVWDKALTYLQQAGAKAYGRSAHREAVAFWETALACLEHLPQSREVSETGIELRMRLRHSLLHLGDFLRQGEHLREAESLAEALGDRRRLAQVSSLLTNYFINTGDVDLALESARRAGAFVAELGDLDIRVMVNFQIGLLDYAIGDYPSGEARLAENVSLIPPARCQDFFGLAVPPSILSRAYRALSLVELGAFDEAIRLGEEAVHLAERFDRTLDRIYAYRALAGAYIRKGDWGPAGPLLEHGLELCRTGNIGHLLLAFAPGLAYLRAMNGRVTDALPFLEETVRSPLFLKHFVNLFPAIWAGEAYLSSSRIQDANDVAQRTLDLARRHRGRGSEAWALRLLGEIASHREAYDVDAAQNHYHQALKLATELRMRPLVAHCHLSLGKLSRCSGNREAAQQYLTTATTMYREMDMQFWLEQAEAELRELT